MIAWVRKMLFDETAFVRLIRAAIMILGAAVQTGQITTLPPVVGAVLMGAAVFIGAGEKNPA
jgi:hypothetical protein